MKKVVALPAPEPLSDNFKKSAWFYAGLLVVMAIGQLFSFENFIPLISAYQLPGDLGTATLIGCLLVAMEVLAVPYLLRMTLSPLMRWVGLVSSVVVPLIWLFLSAFALVHGKNLQNGGLFGSHVHAHVAPQLWAAFVLTVLAVVTAYGLQLFRRK